MPLTDQRIKAAKPRERAYKLTDEKGMHVHVAPSGTRSWRLKYRHQGREKLISFGVYPDTPLKLARARRDDARKLIARGIDPSAERKAERAAHADTFGIIAEEWIGKQELAVETVSIYRGRLNTILIPTFGNRSIKSIEAPDLLAVLRRVEAQGKRETAHRTCSLYARVERYAIATGRLKRGIAADLRGSLAPVAGNHFASITDPKAVGQLLRAIDGYQGQPTVEFALKLAPYLFVRPGELRGAEWSEFDLAGDAPTWRVPGSRMKMGEQHLVPLAPQTVALLRELKKHTGSARLVFPGLIAPSRPISENTLNAALKRLGYGSDQMTPHGFRSMASTLLNELGWHPDLIELQLAHAERNKVRAAYNKAQRLDERRKMMRAYADHLDKLRAGDRKLVAVENVAAAHRA